MKRFRVINNVLVEVVRAGFDRVDPINAWDMEIDKEEYTIVGTVNEIEAIYKSINRHHKKAVKNREKEIWWDSTGDTEFFTEYFEDEIVGIRFKRFMSVWSYASTVLYPLPPIVTSAFMSDSIDQMIWNK